MFLTQLLLLFGFCRSCKEDNPQVDVYQVGTQVVVTTTCSNPKCPKPKDTWQSQPFLPGTKLPAGNFLLCLAILLAGGSASKVFRVFSHMGLGCLSMTTFFTYQRVRTFKRIYCYCIMKDTQKEPFGIEITALLDSLPPPSTLGISNDLPLGECGSALSQQPR